MSKAGQIIFIVLVAAIGMYLAAVGSLQKHTVDSYFEEVKSNPPLMQAFLRAFPKGGDLHNHLAGAIYGESFVNWAAQDGLCVDVKKLSLIMPSDEGCDAVGQVAASTFASDADAVDALIDNISMRSFVPTQGWSGHDQFFSTFANTVRAEKRLGDMLAETAARAGAQNISYLELMTSLDLGGLYGVATSTQWDPSWDVATGYAALMTGTFGQNLEDIIAGEKALMDRMEARKRELLGCDGSQADAGCAVEIRYLYQVIRTVPTSVTFAGFVLGFELAKRDPRVVGINLVAPEDHPIALADYNLHMRMIDFLWAEKGSIDVSLHAGELALGLVMPKHMRSHIREAIDIGHAKRIGHGMDVAYEDRPMELLTQMRENDIMVEINLTSNDMILGIEGDDHPILLYRAAGVPVALSTDDEGVSRIDLTHEYQRAVATYNLSYEEIKQLSKNSVAYSFMSEEDKARVLANLEQKFISFEDMVMSWPQP